MSISRIMSHSVVPLRVSERARVQLAGRREYATLNVRTWRLWLKLSHLPNRCPDPRSFDLQRHTPSVQW